MKPNETSRTYHQNPGSRQGEITAWGLSILLIVVTIFLSSRSGVNFWFLVIDAIIIFSAILITFGNYVSRSTRLTLDDAGIEFFNGIRRISLLWGHIEDILEIPSRLGPKIWLIGNGERIVFQKNSVVKWKEEIRDRIGFLESDEIMEIIMSKVPHLEIRKEEYYYPEE